MVINYSMLTLYEIQLRHACHYQQLLHRITESYLESRTADKSALKTLELEWGNIETGHRWASEKSSGETGVALRAAYAADAALVREWTTPPKELARWAKEGLFAARQLGDREAAGRHLSNLGHACDQMGQFRRALTCHKIALSISREFNNRHTEAEDLFGMGMALLNLCGGRSQAMELCKMGFDRVALARFVVTEPVESGVHHPWMIASARSGVAMDDYTAENKGIFVADDDPFGTVLISIGAVFGKLEHMAGGISAKWFREPADSPYRQTASNVRQAIERNLNALFEQHAFPRTFPVLILACSAEKCGSVYISGANPEVVCPDCGKQPG